MIAKVKKGVAFAVVICLLLCLVSGCGETGSNRALYSLPDSFESVDTQTLASNAKYTLEWDDEYKCVLMRSNATGKVWATTPYDFYQTGDTHSWLSSPIEIEVVQVGSLALSTDRAYSSCISSGNVSATKIDNGIEVTYYFDDWAVSVPVQYVLREDSLAVSVDTTKITEGEEFMLKSVTLAPYMASTANGEADSYLFVPSGNGALMYSASDADGARTYSSEVYGRDGSRVLPEELYKDASVKMPVFGAKDGAHALLGIIEKGAEQAEISANAGNERLGYSFVGSKFYTRGFDVYADKFSYSSTITTRVSKTMVDTVFTVGYYPLADDEADYVGMAKRYQKYLIGKGLVKSEISESAYALSILGNVETRSLAFGVPYISTKSMTTFNEAAAIIKDMADVTKVNPAVQLVGYGQSGLDVGKVAGGFAFADVSGSKDDYAALTEYAQKNSISLFTDFDLICYNKSGNGFFTLMDVAKSATLRKTEQYVNMLALRAHNEDYGKIHLLSRSKLSAAMDKLLKKGDKLQVSGYSFSTLGSIAYSDYAEKQYEMKSNMSVDVQQLLTNVADTGHSLSTDDANDYAAMMSDTIFNVSVEPRNLNAISEYVPFYQIVFKGYVPMYSAALNLAVDYEASVLSALEAGVGLGYTLIDEYDVSYAATVHTNLYSSEYSDKKELIAEAVAEHQEYYKAIQGAQITDHQILDNGVTVTVFDNGVTAYTNKSGTAKTCAAGELAAYGFAFTQGGTN